MAQDPMVGSWVVTHFQGGFAKYKYKYKCSAATSGGSGAVQWIDYWDASENGRGTWKRTSNKINFDWKDSSTKEYWVMAPTLAGDQASGEVRASYGTFTTVAERIDSGDPNPNPKLDLIQTWADNYGDFQSPFLCPWAIPYLLKMPPDCKPLRTKHVGGPIQKVRGLAIHTTWTQHTTVEGAVRGTVGYWNTIETPVSAHFAIAADGVLIQIVPCNRIAWAQGGNADFNWLSVEIVTKESPANPAQLQSARILFQWVANSFNVQKKLATGYIGAASSDPKRIVLAAAAKQSYDPVTKDLCEKASAPTTSKLEESIGSQGLSCHYWLNPVKPCPGTPLLKQLNQIVSA